MALLSDIFHVLCYAFWNFFEDSPFKSWFWICDLFKRVTSLMWYALLVLLIIFFLLELLLFFLFNLGTISLLTFYITAIRKWERMMLVIIGHVPLKMLFPLRVQQGNSCCGFPVFVEVKSVVLAVNSRAGGKRLYFQVEPPSYCD